MIKFNPRMMPLLALFMLFLFMVCFYAPSYSDSVRYEEDLIRMEKKIKAQQKARVVCVLVNSDFIAKQIGQSSITNDWDCKIVTLDCKDADKDEVLSPGSAYWGAIYGSMFSAASRGY